jgi:hypothetical protein
LEVEPKRKVVPCYLMITSKRFTIFEHRKDHVCEF